MKDLVSVVVPVYNVQNYISKCIDSIINQTYKNLEIIIVDDGSPDKCGQICDEYAAKDSRITVIHKENGGLSDARNCGMAAATGEYITFVDSDDCLHLHFIEILMKIAKNKNADIIVGDFVTFKDEDKCQDKELSDSDILAAQVLSDKHLYDNEFIKRETTILTVSWGKIYKRKLWDKIEYPVGKIHEDTFTTYKLMERAHKVVYLKEPLYYWRENSNSITRGKFTTEHLLGLDAFEEQIEYFHSIGKQRYVEIVYEAFNEWFFWCYNEMPKVGIDYKKELRPYYLYMRKHVKLIRLTKSMGFKMWLRERYRVYYRIPKILR